MAGDRGQVVETTVRGKRRETQTERAVLWLPLTTGERLR